MIKNLFLLLLFSSFRSLCQENISFNNGNWWHIVAEAKKTQKPIFIDFYTDWCGGCKMMEQQVLPNKKVVSKFNESFVNYKINAESLEGINIAQRFKIECFPTYVFVDPNSGKTLFKEEGMMLEIPKFLGYANSALGKFKKVAVVVPNEPKVAVIPAKTSKNAKIIVKKGGKEMNKSTKKALKPSKKIAIKKGKLPIKPNKKTIKTKATNSTRIISKKIVSKKIKNKKH